MSVYLCAYLAGAAVVVLHGYYMAAGIDPNAYGYTSESGPVTERECVLARSFTIALIWPAALAFALAVGVFAAAHWVLMWLATRLRRESP